jgi:polysaccharide biosynthesis/export protein
MNRCAHFLLPLFVFAVAAHPQDQATAANPTDVGQSYAATPPVNTQTRPGIEVVQPDYVLGPNDQISLLVPDLEDEFTDKTFRVDMSGNVSLPFMGHLHAAGLTIGGLEQEVKDLLNRVLKDPEVTISVVGFGSEPVSVLGAVNYPGIRQLEGHKTLFEVLSLSGGLRPDAGYLITITRDLKWGQLPLADVKPDPTGRFSVGSVKVKDIRNATSGGENIDIRPGDAIWVSKAELVYAVGSVTKPGGFLLTERDSISALQVISLAEGLLKTAAPDKARILRAVPGSTSRTEIAVDLKQLMAGKGTDIQLRPDDILFVPSSYAKGAGYRTLDAVIAAATGMAIYGKF